MINIFRTQHGARRCPANYSEVKYYLTCYKTSDSLHTVEGKEHQRRRLDQQEQQLKSDATYESYGCFLMLGSQRTHDQVTRWLNPQIITHYLISVRHKLVNIPTLHPKPRTSAEKRLIIPTVHRTKKIVCQAPHKSMRDL